MKILHTADWHLGHILYDYDREDEQRRMILSVVDLAAAEQPDLLLVCGDIFDTSQPSARAQRLWADALIALKKASPAMTVVAIAGNHDSASRHEVFREPWKLLGVHTIGRIMRDCSPSDFIVELPGVAFVGAVPFSGDRNMPDDLFPRILEDIGERNIHDLPVILAAHTAVLGSLARSHTQSPRHDLSVIGGIESRRLDFFGHGYDYLALGHIHCPQTLAGSVGRARYSGSPMPLSFDEKFSHGVTVAEISRGREPLIHHIEIEPMRRLVDLPAVGSASWPRLRSMLEEFPAESDVYLRLNALVDKNLSPVASAEAAAICETKLARFCLINLCRSDNEEAQTLAQGMDIEEFRRLAPLDVAVRYASDRGFPFDDELRMMFAEIVNQCSLPDDEV